MRNVNMNFEFQIELNKKDYFTFYIFDFCTNLNRHLFIFSVWLIGLIFMVVVLHTVVALFLMLLITVILIFFGIVFKLLDWNILTNKIIRNQRNKYKLTFNEETFFSENRFYKLEYKATTFLKMIDTERYLYLYIDEVSAIIVPKNQLTDNLYNDIINFFNKNNITIKNY